MNTTSTAPVIPPSLQNRIDPPKKKKARLCPGVFVAIGILVAEILYLFIDGNFRWVIDSFLYIEFDFYSILNLIYAILDPVFYHLVLIALIVILFLRKPNISVSIFLLFAFALPCLCYLILNVIQIFYGHYGINIQEISYWLRELLLLVSNFFICAVCLVFALKSPKTKNFVQKHKKLITIFIPALYFCLSLLSYIIYCINWIIDCFRYGFYSPSIYIIKCILITLPLTTLLYFFVLRWLADPYKKDKTQKAPVQTVGTMPPPPVRPAVKKPIAPAQPKAVETKPVNPRQAPFVQPTVNNSAPSLVDELARCRELLDNGTITQEEFEQAKAKILNN